MFRRDRVDRIAGTGKFRRGVDEKTSAKILLRKPFAVGIEEGKQSIAGGIGALLDIAHEPIAKALVTPA